MAGINLSQSTQARNQQPASPFLDKSFVIPASLLVVAFGVYGGLLLYNSSLVAQSKSLQDEIATQTEGLNSATVNRVIDFQDRMTNIDDKLKEDDSMKKAQTSSPEMLAVMEKNIVSGVSLSSYEYNMEAKLLTLKLSANDFKDIARQVTNFKSVAAFTGVTVSDTAKAEDGSITASVIITL